MGNVHSYTGKYVGSIGWRQKAFIARSTCLCWSFPRLETFSSQQQSSRLVELLPNDVPDRYFVSLINKAATLRDLFALPSAFHRLCIAVYPRAWPIVQRVVLFIHLEPEVLSIEWNRVHWQRKKEREREKGWESIRRIYIHLKCRIRAKEI